jgi:BolA protein
MHTSEETRQLIAHRIEDKLGPAHLEVIDDTAAHAGHPGLLMQEGGGHFRIQVVAEAFEGLSLIDQHRLIHDAVGYPMEGRIHALDIKTIPPSRYQP